MALFPSHSHDLWLLLCWAFFSVLDLCTTTAFSCTAISGRESFVFRKPRISSGFSSLSNDLISFHKPLIIRGDGRYRSTFYYTTPERPAFEEDYVQHPNALLRVVYEDSDLIVIDKPPGLSFHKDNEEGQGVFQIFRQMQEDGRIQYQGDVFSVHRLDKVTSGLLVLAKTKDTQTLLQQAFEKKAVQKYYVAMSDKKTEKKMGSVVGDMVKSRRSQWKLTRTKDNPSVTKFVSWKLKTDGTGPLYAFLLKPETGRTHQLRVALKSVAAPILGDPLYGPASKDADRCYLHAAGIGIELEGRQPLCIALSPHLGKHFQQEIFKQVWSTDILPLMMGKKSDTVPKNFCSFKEINMLVCGNDKIAFSAE